MTLKLRTSLFLVLALVLTLSGCGGGGGSSNPATAPSVPTNLTAVGTLGHINLSWTASTGGGLTGYNVYRSTDGVNFAKINSAIVAAAAYDDAIDSSGDGIFYQYRVKAVGDAESNPSNVVKSMHGTRLAATYASDTTFTATSSPYVVEGTVTTEGSLTFNGGTKLYILDNGSIDFLKSKIFFVYGLLRVLASESTPATFTAHGSGGASLADGEGFSLFISNAPSYNTGDGSGTLIQNTRIEKLCAGGAISIGNCTPKFDNCKISSNQTTGGSYFNVYNNGGLIMNRCSLDKIVLEFSCDQTARATKVDYNVLRSGYYAISFFTQPGPCVNSGQIENNDFDGTKQVYLFQVTGSGNVPLGNNYWYGGSGSPPKAPVLYSDTPSVLVDFGTALASAPAGVGPTW